MNIDRKILQEILNVAVCAPSGGNSQPWSFQIRGDEVIVLYQPEKDHPVLNVQSRGTLFAHGALLENISITSPTYALEAKTTLLPQIPNSTAAIKFNRSVDVKIDPLASFITKRASNRKPFLNKSLSSEVLEEFQKIKPVSDNVKLGFISEKESINSISKALGIGDEMMFGKEKLRRLLFKELVWTRAEEKAKGGGLFVETLELKQPQKFVLKLLKFRPLGLLGVKLGINKKIAEENSKIYASSPLLCVISVKGDSKSFLEAGGLLEKVWLTATQLGLSAQIVTTLFFFWQGIQEGSTGSIFSERDQKRIKDAYNLIAQKILVGDKMITAVLRVGYAEPPSTTSFKLPAKIVD